KRCDPACICPRGIMALFLPSPDLRKTEPALLGEVVSMRMCPLCTAMRAACRAGDPKATFRCIAVTLVIENSPPALVMAFFEVSETKATVAPEMAAPLSSFTVALRAETSATAIVRMHIAVMSFMEQPCRNNPLRPGNRLFGGEKPRWGPTWDPDMWAN